MNLYTIVKTFNICVILIIRSYITYILHYNLLHYRHRTQQSIVKTFNICLILIIRFYITYILHYNNLHYRNTIVVLDCNIIQYRHTKLHTIKCKEKEEEEV